MIKITMIILYTHPSADPPPPAPERECRLLAALQGTADPTLPAAPQQQQSTIQSGQKQ